MNTEEIVAEAIHRWVAANYSTQYNHVGDSNQLGFGIIDHLHLNPENGRRMHVMTVYVDLEGTMASVLIDDYAHKKTSKFKSDAASPDFFQRLALEINGRLLTPDQYLWYESGSPRTRDEYGQLT